jgi:hypothetical protein
MTILTTVNSSVKFILSIATGESTALSTPESINNPYLDTGLDIIVLKHSTELGTVESINNPYYLVLYYYYWHLIIYIIYHYYYWPIIII